MKNFALLLIFLILSSCISYDIKEIKPNELGMSLDFRGRIFKIKCSDDNGLGIDVDEHCKYYMSKLAYDNGYQYFSVLDKGSNSKTSVSSYSNNYYSGIHYDEISEFIYSFILINVDEINTMDNYYIVSDYYPRNHKSRKKLEKKFYNL